MGEVYCARNSRLGREVAVKILRAKGRSGPRVRTIGAGFLVATIIAVAIGVPTIGGISTWKVVLGVIGLVIFVRTGRR